MSQKARVLAALRSRGARGITQVDFLAPNVIDGGRPITRVAPRIHELRTKDGHEIAVDGERDSCAVYRLVRDAQDMRRAADVADALIATSKFQAVKAVADAWYDAGPTSRLAIFDDDVEAA